MKDLRRVQRQLQGIFLRFLFTYDFILMCFLFFFSHELHRGTSPDPGPDPSPDTSPNQRQETSLKNQIPDRFKTRQETVDQDQTRGPMF